MTAMLRPVDPNETLPEPLSSIEAEASLLGALMIENALFAHVGKHLAAEDFHEPIHGRIYAAISEAIGSGKTASPVLLKPLFEDDEALRELGGVKYLINLTGDAQGLLAARELAEQIRDYAVRRRVRDGLRDALDACSDLHAKTADIVSLAGEAIESVPGRSTLRVIDAFDFDESSIPTRPWLIPGVILSGQTHVLAAPGGSGKSLFTLQLAIAMARGERWGDFVPRKRARSLIINVEDDTDEQRRRLAAARKVMKTDQRDLRDMVQLVDNAEDIVVSAFEPERRTFITTPVVRELQKTIEENKIDVLIVDPFAETFEGDENSNSEVKWAMRVWRDRIARKCGCAVYLVHHTIKNSANGAGDANIVRGGGGIVNSTRVAATLMPMSSDDADAIGINQAERHLYVRYDDAKANQSLKTSKARWFEKRTVELDNGAHGIPADEVGALVPWHPPSPFDGITTTHLKRVQTAVGNGRWRENQQANEWVGHAVAEVLMLDVNDQKDRKRIVALLREWIANDVLQVVEDEDAKRMKRKFVEVGTWITE